MSGIVCDKRMPFTLKAAVYKTVIRHVLVYVIEISALRKAEQNFLERREMRMFRWVMGVERVEKIRNEEIKARTCVENIIEKIREARLRRLDHIQRHSEEDVVMRTWTMEVSGSRKKTQTEAE